LEFGQSQSVEMTRSGEGIFECSAKASSGDRYSYILNGGDQRLPDPVSRSLPEGVHGRTEIVDPENFRWSDEDWSGIPITEYVIYELHVGTFSPEGTFDGAIQRLGHLRSLGVTALEIMPVAAFPGERNWGYDGVSPYAVQHSYGGPAGLKRLVNEAHKIGLAVMLDVVYNHVGNEGNYLRQFGPYFTDRYKTAWGDAINYDGSESEHVRRYVVENALYWIREYHMDGLRLDAIQTIIDSSPMHIVAEIQRDVQEFARGAARKVCTIAESDQNDRKLLLPRSEGGFGLDAVWTDDFHHAIHTVLTGEKLGYYQDYGDREKIAKALNEGFVFQGQHFRFWKASRGTSAEGIELYRHVICLQNHDQVGNRCHGERLSSLVPRGALKAAAAILLLAPHTPLLFMGEEYGEQHPFQFFTDFGDENLQRAVIEGRREEFADFGWDETPNPQDPETFNHSKLSWQIDNDMLGWYKQLLALRKQFITYSDRTCKAQMSEGKIVFQIPASDPALRVEVSLGGDARRIRPAQSGDMLLHYAADGYEVSIIDARSAADHKVSEQKAA
jgi:maltooligosyltrehalose trehalohydrolase